jgi:septal ring factor EnvC (AmiA/AmiB activator)
MGLALVAGLASMSVLAAGQDDTKSLSQQRLETLEQEISTSEQKAEEIAQDAAAIRKAYSALQKRMVGLAAEIRTVEEDIESANDRLAELAIADREAALALEKQAATMAQTLAAMQRLSQRPTSALITKPDSIETMARTSLLFDSILPPLRAQAEILRQQIDAVDTIRNDIRQERAVLQERQDKLDDDRNQLARLSEEKKRQQRALGRALQQEQARIAALTREAKDLEDLMQKLSLPKRSTIQPGFEGVGQPLDSLPFASAQGKLNLPARGVVVSRFNSKAELGTRTKGIEVETGPRAEVTSVWDGNVMYAGVFRDYGQLLIISHGDGYHSLLAGLGRIDVGLSQWVLAGEPVGAMSTQNRKESAESAGESQKNSPESDKPRLYLELRQKGRSIDPLPWIAVSQRKVKG